MLNSGTTNRSPIIALTIVLKGTIYSGAQMTIVTYCNLGNPVMQLKKHKNKNNPIQKLFSMIFLLNALKIATMPWIAVLL